MFIGQAWHEGGEIPPDIVKMIEATEQYANDMGIGYEFRRFPGGDDPVVESDSYRNYWAIDNPQLLWADCDVQFTKKLPDEFVGDLPYFYWMPGRGGWCNAIFFANGNTDLFERLQRLGEHKGKTNNYFWTSKLMNRWEKCAEQFPAIYEHQFLTTGS